MPVQIDYTYRTPRTITLLVVRLLSNAPSGLLQWVTVQCCTSPCSLLTFPHCNKTHKEFPEDRSAGPICNLLACPGPPRSCGYRHLFLLTRRKAAAMRGKVVYIYMGKWSIISPVNPVVPNMEILNKDLHPFRVWLLWQSPAESSNSWGTNCFA